MEWKKCLHFTNNKQCTNKKLSNGVCKKHKNVQFEGEYLFTCLSGEGYLYPNKLCNQTDIISLENIWEFKNKKQVTNLEFPRELLFSFYDNNKLYGFNILSFVKDIHEFLKIKISDIDLLNPITKNQLTPMTKMKMKLKLQYLLDFNHPTIINYRVNLKPFDELLNIIIKLENHGFFFNPNWFKNLTSLQIKNIINETKMIWNEYNSTLHFNTPPFYLNINTLVEFYQNIINIDDININNKIIIILGGLAYVIPEVKILYPDLLHE